MQITRWIESKVKRRFPTFLYYLIPLIILLSILSLDYILWKKEKKSYQFSNLSEKQSPIYEEKNLREDVLHALSSLDFPPSSIQHYRDDQGNQHIIVDLSIRKFETLQPLLERAFQEKKFDILKKEENQDLEKNYHLWEIRGPSNQRLSLLFACHKKEEKTEHEDIVNKVAIIIDDMGYRLDLIKEISSIPIPLTISILPHTPQDEETAKIAHENHIEVMLHLPLESLNNLEINKKTQGIITSQMTPAEIIKTLAENLEQIPYIAGVNNHMGSKITQDETIISVILNQLKEKNMYFIDSVTTGRSVAYKVAQKLEIPSAPRDFFLDEEANEEYIKTQLTELFRLAQKKGRAIGICHPRKNTLKVLKENLHLMEKFKVKPVFVSEIIQK